MKINCLLQNLKDAVQIAERNTSRNQTLPILNSIFIEAEAGKIKIKATNLETAVAITLSGKVEENGSVAVPAKTLSMFLSNISDNQITLESKKENLFIKSGKNQTLIKGMASEDFPLLPKVEEIESFKIPALELRNAISNVIIASSLSDIKPELSSMLFKVFRNTLKLATTDSFRLAEYTTVLKNISSEKMVSFLIPQKSVQEILKLINKEDNITLGFSKNQLVVSLDNIYFISRLTDGVFPDYEQIIPKKFKITLIAKKADVLSNLKLSNVFVGKLNDINISFNGSKKTMVFQASNQDTGEYSSEISANGEGDDVSIKFNVKYLIDGISQINQEYIVFNLNGAESALLIHGKSDNSYIYLVMPMRGV